MPRRPTLVRAVAALALAASLLPATAEAQSWLGGPPPARRFVHRNSLFFRLNPLGFIHDGRFMYRQRLYYDESDALADNFVAIGISPSLSPAFGRVGAYAEFQPATIFTLYANYEVVAYTGGFNFLQSFQSATADYSDTRIKTLANKDLTPDVAARNYSTTGTQLTLGANFQMKFGNVVVRSLFRAVRPDYNLRTGDRVFYDVVYDILAPNKGWFVTNDADLLWQGELGPQGQQLTFGVRHTYTGMFYDARHFAEGEAVVDPVGGMHRVGPLVSYAFSQKNREAWNAPTLTAGFQWWLAHKWRTGVDVSQAIPLFLLGFSVNGDLMNSRGG